MICIFVKGDIQPKISPLHIRRLYDNLHTGGNNAALEKGAKMATIVDTIHTLADMAWSMKDSSHVHMDELSVQLTLAREAASARKYSRAAADDVWDAIGHFRTAVDTMHAPSAFLELDQDTIDDEWDKCVSCLEDATGKLFTIAHGNDLYRED